jgi:hypothetical protein
MTGQQPRRRLDGWKLIAAWVHLSERQVKKLASTTRPREERLPIFRLNRGPTTRVCAWSNELDEWQLRMQELTSNVHA